MKNIHNNIKASFIAFILIFCTLFSTTSRAQCKTFYNADAMNPLLHLSPQPVHIYNIAFVDIDGDGDLDCYVGGTFNNANINDAMMQLYTNIGDAHHPVYKYTSAAPFPASLLQFVDIDGDGDYDAIASFFESNPISEENYDKIVLFRNTGTAKVGNFIQEPNISFLPQNTFGTDGRDDLDFYSFFDINKDGKPDYNCSIIDLDGFHNVTFFDTGTVTNPGYKEYAHDLNVGTHIYYDWNKDGLPDYFAGFGATVAYYRNNGPLSAPLFTADAANAPQFLNGNPAYFVDLDGDGIPEVFTVDGHYSTLVPVAAIKVVLTNDFNHTVTRLMSVNNSRGDKYSWEKDNRLLIGQNKAYLDVTEPGAYVLRVTDACGTGVSLPYNKVARRN